MNTFDNALRQFDLWYRELNGMLANHYSEADTRVKFIDPILTRVLGWDEAKNITREESYTTDEGRRCIDYTLSLERVMHFRSGQVPSA
jgi:hypothetical protein